MKLISMTEFVLQHKGNTEFHMNNTIIETGKMMQKVFKYADFLRQPLTLGMFVPVGEEGNVLEKPVHYEKWLCQYNRGFEHDYEALIQNEYRKAKEKVLFEGFETLRDSALKGVVIRMSDLKRIYVHENTTIERFTHLNIELTPSALKQIGYEKDM